MKLVWIFIAALALGAFVFYKTASGRIVAAEMTDKKARKHHVGANGTASDDAPVQVLRKWELPSRLREISGLAWIDADRFLCVQDEEGSVFVYNTKRNEIEKEIPFGPAGDYEGVTLNGSTAWVVRSDGQLWEVPLGGGKARKYDTPLTAAHNIEGLFYDRSADRLLLATKASDPWSPGNRSVYAFDVKSKTLSRQAVLQFDASDPALGSGKKKKKGALEPSALALHPRNGSIYVLDGPRSRLMVAGTDGSIQSVIELGKEFAQPEGVTFSPSGATFISNEGVKGPATIMEVRVE